MSKGVSAESLRVTEVSNPGSRKTSIPKDPNNINPYGESAPQKNVSGEKDEKKADPNNPKQSQAGKGSGLGLLSAIPAIAATPPPPANILKVIPYSIVYFLLTTCHAGGHLWPARHVRGGTFEARWS